MVQQRLTVVQILPAMEPGGMERGAIEVGAELVRCGHQSWVISGGGPLVSRLTGQGSRHMQWPIGKKSLWSLRWVRRLRAFLDEQQVDILHARSRMPAWVACRALKGMPEERRPRLVTTVHCLYPVNRYSAVVTRGDKIIAVSDTAQRYILENYPKVDPGRVEVICRGVDRAVYPYGYRPADSWYQRWFNEFPFLLERFVLTLPADYACTKGYSDFFDLMARLVHEGVPVHGLIVAGEYAALERQLPRLQAESARRSLDQHITVMRQRLDIREIYAASNLVLYLSHVPRAQSMALLETLAMGVPTLGYDHGIVREYMARVFPGGLVEPACVDTLHRKVKDIYRMKPERPCVGLPSHQAEIAAIMALYHSLVVS